MLSGWLSPQGIMYECPYWGHIDLAYEILNTQYGQRHFYDNTPDETLVERGWIKLYTSIFSHNQEIYFKDSYRATLEQKDFLKNNYEQYPDNWSKVGIYELKFLGVLDEEYDEDGCLI